MPHIHTCILYIPTLKTALLFQHYAGMLDAVLNEGYSSASFRLVVVSAVMLQQLALFGKVAASQKVHVYGKLNRQTTTDNFWILLFLINVTVLPCCHHSKKSWWMLHGKQPVMARMTWLFQTFRLPARMTVSAWWKALLFEFLEFPFDTKVLSGTEFPFDVMINNWNPHVRTFVFKATNSSILASEQSAICIWMGDGGQTYMKVITFRK